jgi:hypothetical protein
MSAASARYLLDTGLRRYDGLTKCHSIIQPLYQYNTIEFRDYGIASARHAIFAVTMIMFCFPIPNG